MRIRVAAALLGLVILGTTATTAWSARYRYDPEDGPIDGSQNGLGYSQPLEVSQEFSIGITSLYNSGSRPAVVERVRLLGVTGDLDLLGVMTRLLTQDSGELLIGDYGFPPTRFPSKPLTEQRIVPVQKAPDTEGDSPRDGLELVIGIRATAPGVAGYRAVEVRYRVGGRRYREVFEANTVHLCAPLAEYSDPVTYRRIQDCPPRDQQDRFEDRVLEWPPAGAKDASG